MVKTLTIVKMRDVLQALRDKSDDAAWLKKKELEVCNGLRSEAEKHGR